MKCWNSKKRMRGYTLVEMIVSVGLFSVVMLVATAAYLAMISLDRQTRAVNDVVNNLSFTVDTMSRALRTGHNYFCATGDDLGNCWNTPGNSMTFTDDQGRTITYLVKTDSITGKHSIGRCTSTPCSQSTAPAVTDPRIDIDPTTGLNFYVKGMGSYGSTGDIIQPRVLVTIRGTMAVDSKTLPASFSVETLAVQRLIDL